MAQKLPWSPWHNVVRLREDVRTGALSLADFAADLHDVMMQKGARPIYEDPAQFFALTYPTFSLRELAKDVVLRLAGKNTKAIRQLELTYGGGKTHTLVTLRHLVHDPASLPSLPAVQQFKSHIGATLPKACVVALSFDKLDVEKGMEVRGPKGEMRWLTHPWSVLAFQIAGNEGLRALHADGKDEERETPPAEPLLVDLLSRPQAEGLATLVLIDEVLMYAREKVAMAEVWRPRLKDFFQYLCQAATKVDRCAVVASLLASDPEKSDPFGKELIVNLRDLQSAEGGGRPTGAEGRCSRGAAPPLLRTCIDRRRRGLPPTRYDGRSQHRRARRDRPEGQIERGGPISRQLPLSPRPHRHLLHALDTVGRVPAHTRHPADIRACAAGRGEMGRFAVSRSERVLTGAGPRGHRRGGTRTDRNCHARGHRGPWA
jgi:hypothetical protein